MDPTSSVAEVPITLLDISGVLGVEGREIIVMKLGPRRIENAVRDLGNLRMHNPQLFRDEYNANLQRVRDAVSKVGGSVAPDFQDRLRARLTYDELAKLVNACVNILTFRQLVAGVRVPVYTGQEALNLLARVSDAEDPVSGGFWKQKSRKLRRKSIRKSRRKSIRKSRRKSIRKSR